METKINSICKKETTRCSKKLFHCRVRTMLFSKINIAHISNFLKRVDFYMIVDHLALTHIIKCKAEPVTTRIKRLLELISSYSFNLYYTKGKDMILSDFLSRQNHDNSNPHEITPISFNMHTLLHERYYNTGKTEKYLVQTISKTRSSGIQLLEVHGVRIWILISNQKNKTLDH